MSMLWLATAMALAGIVVAYVSMLDGVLILDGAADRVGTSWWFALVPCAAAAVVVAERSLHARHSVTVLVLALVSVALARARPGPGLLLSAVSLWFCALVLLTTPVGHD
jgi:hypothetical protein